MIDPFSLPFFQRGIWEIVILSLACGPLGTWIVLRGLAFFAHAVGTASFPGLVLADGLGFPASIGALATAALFSDVGSGLATTRRVTYDSLTALTLAGFLAAGVILASDVFHSGANIETLLFGSLLLISNSDLALSGAVAVLVLTLNYWLGARWLAAGFDPQTRASVAGRTTLHDAVLLGLLAAASTVALSVIGALLVSSLLLIPAATTRLFCRRIPSWQVATTLLTAVEGVAGLWLSVQTNAPPGSTIAVLSGSVFAAAAVWRTFASRSRAPRAETAEVAA